MSIEPDSGVSFELHDLQSDSAFSMSAQGDERRGSKVIVVAEMADHNPEFSCDKIIFRKNSDVKNLATDTDLSRKSTNRPKEAARKKTKSTQELIPSEEIEVFEEVCDKEEGCYWFEPAGQSEESLVQHDQLNQLNHLTFEPEPYYGVREWL